MTEPQKPRAMNTPDKTIEERADEAVRKLYYPFDPLAGNDATALNWRLGYIAGANDMEVTEDSRSCPCLYLDEPCHPHCTCKNGISSHGCLYCCTYGSIEQRTEKAKWLAAQIKAGATSHAPAITEDVPVQKEVGEKRILHGDYSGVCYNCLNGYHNGCDVDGCKCAEKNHKPWWWKTQTEIDLEAQSTPLVQKEVDEKIAIAFAEWIDGCGYSRIPYEDRYGEWTDGNETVGETTVDLFNFFKSKSTPPIHGEGQDELWDEVGAFTYGSIKFTWNHEKMDVLKSKYHITRKQ
jgi:hypothetical protein